jgi:hypothetical protein
LCLRGGTEGKFSINRKVSKVNLSESERERGKRDWNLRTGETWSSVIKRKVVVLDTHN